jgi:hypothetical protein
MSFRLGAIVEGRPNQTAGMTWPREVIRNRDNMVVAYIDSENGPPKVSNDLSKNDVKALGRLRRTDGSGGEPFVSR